MTLSSHSLIVAASNQLAASIGGDTVILELVAGRYYGVDAVGARIWQLIQEPIAVGDVWRTLVSEYDVDPVRCEADLLGILEEMIAARLVEVRSVATT
jgi:hypothetical protein